MNNLIEELVEQRVNTGHKMFLVLNGSKTKRKAASDVLSTVTRVQRGAVHKKPIVVEQLLKKYQNQVSKRPAKACNMVQYLNVENGSSDLRRKLKSVNLSHARAIEEGIEETLSLYKLGMSGILHKTLQSTP